MNQFDLVCLGELLVDMFPGEIGKGLEEVRSFTPKPGGAPANVAVAASRLGATTAFIGKVGEDHFGKYLAQLLAEEGVNTEGLRFNPQVRTTMAIIAQPTIDEAQFVFYRNPGADQTLTGEELDHSILLSSKILHTGTLSLTDEPARTATWEAIRIARGGGALISCDVNYRPALWRDAGQALVEIERLLPEIDFLKVNENEARLISGSVHPRAGHVDELETAADVMLAKGPKLVVISLGSEGSYFKVKGSPGQVVKSFEVESVDSVGCGDAFVAGLLTQIVSREEGGLDLDPKFLQKAVRFANAVGAITSTVKGAIPAMPTLSEVNEFLARRGVDSP
jgi:fructokinase